MLETRAESHKSTARCWALSFDLARFSRHSVFRILSNPGGTKAEDNLVFGDSSLNQFLCYSMFGAVALNPHLAVRNVNVTRLMYTRLPLSHPTFTNK